MRKRSYLLLSGGKLLSKALGGLREILLARFFGTGRAADAYRGSLTLTLSSMHLFTWVLQAAFVPLYTRLKEEDEEDAWALFQALLLGTTGIGIALAVLLFLFAGPLVRIVLPGFGPERAELTVVMLRIAAFGVPDYIYCSLLGALGAAQDHFVIPALRPGFQNLGMLVMIVVAASLRRPEIAAFGFTAAYWIIAAGATALLRSAGKFPSRWVADRAAARRLGPGLWTLVKPLLMLTAVLEGGILFERFITSRLGAGSVASVDYARFVTETAHTLVIVPLGLMSLTYFARLDAGALHKKADELLTLILAFMIPLSAFLCFQGREVLSFLYVRGEFDASSLDMTAHALTGLAIGLSIYSASFLLQRILNARLRNDVVLRAEAISIVVNVLFLSLFFRRFGLMTVGLGIALGSICSLAWYVRSLRLRPGTAVRSTAVVIVAVPLYWLVARLGGTLGGGPAALALQLLFALLFWGGVTLATPGTRRLLFAKAGRSER